MIFKSQLHILLATVLVIFAGAIDTLAVSVEEYRSALKTTHETVLKMISESDTDSWSASNSFDAEAVISIRKLLPIELNVDSSSGTTLVSNQWLHSRLDHYVTEKDATKQYTILIEIEERLSAIIWKLDEVTKAAAAETSKDQAKQKLNEILSREEFQKPSEKEKSWIETAITNFLDWLASLFPKSQIAPSTSGSTNIAYWLQIVVFVLVGLLFAFGIYKLAPVIFPSLKRKKKNEEKEDRVILGEMIEAGRSSDDLYAEAEKLAQSGDLRGAIRKGYIALLFDLSNKKQIGLARHKTNRDYLRDVRKKPELYSGMRALTNVYESHWYGNAASDESAWMGFRQLCRDTSAKS